MTRTVGLETEASRFVSRHIRARHADLFLADAAILMEGSAERMMLPNFIKNDFQRLHQDYITILEAGGSHAHKLKSLMDTLGPTILIIIDLDARKGEAVQPEIGEEQVTNNDTLKSWRPRKSTATARPSAGQGALQGAAAGRAPLQSDQTAPLRRPALR